MARKKRRRRRGIFGGIDWTDLGGPSGHSAKAQTRIWQNMNAADLGVPVGTPVYAPRGGRLVGGFGESSNSAGTVFGKRLTIQTPSGNQIFLTHMGRYAKGLKAGQRVRRGQLLGFVGAMPGGPSHLHIAKLRGDPYKLARGGFPVQGSGGRGGGPRGAAPQRTADSGGGVAALIAALQGGPQLAYTPIAGPNTAQVLAGLTPGQRPGMPTLPNMVVPDRTSSLEADLAELRRNLLL